MKQINPLYIILLLLVVLSFVLFKLIHAKNALHEAQNEFHKTKAMIHNIVDLRQNWEDKKETTNALRRILKSSMLRNAGVVQEGKRGIIELHCRSIDSKSASYLVNRLLNAPFTIKSMKIRRLDKEHASLDVEVKL